MALGLIIVRPWMVPCRDQVFSVYEQLRVHGQRFTSPCPFRCSIAMDVLSQQCHAAVFYTDSKLGNRSHDASNCCLAKIGSAGAWQRSCQACSAEPQSYLGVPQVHRQPCHPESQRLPHLLILHTQRHPLSLSSAAYCLSAALRKCQSAFCWLLQRVLIGFQAGPWKQRALSLTLQSSALHPQQDPSWSCMLSQANRSNIVSLRRTCLSVSLTLLVLL